MISVCLFVQNSFTHKRQRQFINELIYLLNNQAALHGSAKTKAKGSATCSGFILGENLHNHHFRCYSLKRHCHTKKYHWKIQYVDLLFWKRSKKCSKLRYSYFLAGESKWSHWSHRVEVKWVRKKQKVRSNGPEKKKKREWLHIYLWYHPCCFSQALFFHSA